jgi:hypothetical protein
MDSPSRRQPKYPLYDPVVNTVPTKSRSGDGDDGGFARLAVASGGARDQVGCAAWLHELACRPTPLEVVAAHHQGTASGTSRSTRCAAALKQSRRLGKEALYFLGYLGSWTAHQTLVTALVRGSAYRED